MRLQDLLLQCGQYWDNSSTKVKVLGGTLALGGSLALTHFLVRRRYPLPARYMDMSRRSVFITGCDSGFGYSLALHCHRKLGVKVFAGKSKKIAFLARPTSKFLPVSLKKKNSFLSATGFFSH